MEKPPSFHLALSNRTIIAIVVLLLIVSGLGWWLYAGLPKTFTIQIQSDTSWAGAIGADGRTRSVEGMFNAEFKITGTIASAVIQKNTISGTLTVRILCDSRVVASETTTAAYGVVSVAAS